MTLYLQTQSLGNWPAPLESTWQGLGGQRTNQLAHLGLADILFMTTVMSIPRPQRPWGIVTWMSNVFALSRPGLYEMIQRVRERLLAETRPVAMLEPGEKTTRTRIEITPNRLVRTVLTAAFPGKMAIRPTQHLLSEAFGYSRSVGWVSNLLTEAGCRAGQALGQIDATCLNAVIDARDETFFQALE